MPPSIKELRDLGLTDKQVVDVFEIYEREHKAQRAIWREQKRNWRANVQKTSTGRPADKGRIEEERKKELPSIEVLRGTSISGRAKRKRPLPDDWNPVIAEADAAELQRFRDYAKANNRLYADWDAAWRNWKTSPYRKPNGEHSNGRPQRHASQVAYDLADEWRRREADIERGGLFGAADNAQIG